MEAEQIQKIQLWTFQPQEVTLEMYGVSVAHDAHDQPQANWISILMSMNMDENLIQTDPDNTLEIQECSGPPKEHPSPRVEG